MSKVQVMRDFVSQRLTAAAEEIFELFERTIAEYEEELCRSKENQHKLPDAVSNPEVRLHGPDVQQLLVREQEGPPEQQEWSPSLDQEDLTACQLMKKELEELSISQEREQLQGPEEAHVTKFIFTPVPVKSEEDDEKPQASQLHQTQTEQSSDAEHLKTEADGEDCGKTSHSSQTEVSRCGWEETSEPQSGLNCLNPLQNERSVSDMKGKTGKTFLSLSECATSFGPQENKDIQTGPKRLICSVCKKTFPWKSELVRHMRTHSGEKPFSCSVCGSRFTRSSTLYSHLRAHTGEKPFTCSICKTTFSRRNYLVSHMRSHTGEKSFFCSVCGKRFARYQNLRQHMTVHTGKTI
uniref:zinc finger protein OZF-like n=1 Tax=Semicossyphus pulcher TaxID=241346 RepID=UPI0037E779B8